MTTHIMLTVLASEVTHIKPIFLLLIDLDYVPYTFDGASFRDDIFEW